MSSNSVSVRIEYDEKFRDLVAERDRSDPLTGMKVKVGDKYVLGRGDLVASDYMSTNLTVQLESVEKILSNNKVFVEYANGPMWLVFEPQDEETVMITGCATFEGVQDPDQRTPVDRSAVAPKIAWVSELVKAAEQFYERVLRLNPELENDQILQRLQTEISNANGLIGELK